MVHLSFKRQVDGNSHSLERERERERELPKSKCGRSGTRVLAVALVDSKILSFSNFTAKGRAQEEEEEAEEMQEEESLPK